MSTILSHRNGAADKHRVADIQTTCFKEQPPVLQSTYKGTVIYTYFYRIKQR